MSDRGLPPRPQNFISRAEYMKVLKFPENHPNLVIIPSNTKGTGFLRSCYDKEILQCLMTEEEFIQIVDQASKITATVYSNKRLADTTGVSFTKLVLMRVAFVMALVYIAMEYVAIRFEL